MTLNNIIDLNNMTIELIDRQDYKAAIKTSSTALRLQKTFQKEMSENGADEAHSGSVLDQCMLLSTFNESKSSPAHTFIYNQGIHLPPTLTNIAPVSAILIFNAALAQQLCAETCNQVDSTEHLLKAKRIYGLASRLRDVVHQNVLFQFALVNNTAVIEEKIGGKQASEAHYEFLMAAFMLFVDQKCFRHIRQVRGFLRNASSTQQKDAAAAA